MRTATDLRCPEGTRLTRETVSHHLVPTRYRTTGNVLRCRYCGLSEREILARQTEGGRDAKED